MARKTSLKKDNKEKPEKAVAPKKKTSNKKATKVEKPIVEEVQVEEIKPQIKTSDANLPEVVNVLDESINEKDYSALTSGDEAKYQDITIPEQVIVPPSIEEYLNGGEEEEDKKAEKLSSQKAQVVEEEHEEKKPNVFEKEYQNSPDGNESSKRLAKVVVRFYKYAWIGVGKLTGVTVEDIIKKIEDGKLHHKILEFEIQVSPNVTKTVYEIVEETSEAIDDITTLSSEDEERLLKLLSEFFVIKGWGLSKELEVIFEFGEHLVGTTMELISVKLMLKNTLKAVNNNLLAEEREEQEEEPPAPKQKKEEPPAPKPQESDNVNVNNQSQSPQNTDDDGGGDGVTDVEILEPEEKEEQ